jgi:hypothetical protein
LMLRVVISCRNRVHLAQWIHWAISVQLFNDFMGIRFIKVRITTRRPKTGMSPASCGILQCELKISEEDSCRIPAARKPASHQGDY